ncbi:MAG: sigma-70 family RNA polymerase sigma factor [Verrucomicrobiae bacterium]|nr:sigma-70 family RNA polymerase sigma factor [Verrucomicrobiae bacterium]
MTGDNADLAALRERARTGDNEAARLLVEALYPRVLRIVRGHLPARTAEEDLVQDIFLRVFNRLDRYRERDGVPFEHWVSRLAVRVCLDRLRSERRRPELRWSDLSEDQQRWFDHLAGDDTAPDADDPNSVRELLERLLAQLPAEDRLVLTWLDLEGRSVKEIARLAGWTGVRVKVRAFRARAKLRRLVGHYRKEHPHERF